MTLWLLGPSSLILSHTCLSFSFRMIKGPRIKLIRRAVRVAPAVLKVMYLKRLNRMKLLLNGKSRW